MGSFSSQGNDGRSDAFTPVPPPAFDAADVDAATARVTAALDAEGRDAALVDAAAREAVRAFFHAVGSTYGGDGPIDAPMAFRRAGLGADALASAHGIVAEVVLDRFGEASGLLGVSSARAVTKALAKLAGEALAVERAYAAEVAATLEAFSVEADEARVQSTSAADSADMVVMNVKMVTAMVSQIQHGTQSVARGTTDSKGAADKVLAVVEKSDAQIQHLARLGDHIRKVVRVISNIAKETNMLALNAKIEAVRGSDAGRGFGVVAEEVKTLARETGTAAADIEERITEIARATEAAALSMRETRTCVGRIHELVGQISSAAEEQLGLVDGIGTYMNEAAESVEGITQTIVRANERLSAAVARSRTSLAEAASGDTQ